jgi:hypothetical protein
MRFSRQLLVFFLKTASFAHSQDIYQPCPLLGPRFPLPTGLSSAHALQAALVNLTAALDALSTGDSGEFSATTNSTTFSIALFSSDPLANTSSPLFYQYHHTALNSTAPSINVQKVHADTVYNVARVTTVFTVYAFLIAVGEAHWLDPITTHIPELASLGGNGHVASGNWEDVRLIDLASNMAGIARDGNVSALLNSFSNSNSNQSYIRHSFRQANSKSFGCNLTREEPKFRLQALQVPPRLSEVYSGTAADQSPIKHPNLFECRLSASRSITGKNQRSAL